MEQEVERVGSLRKWTKTVSLWLAATFLAVGGPLLLAWLAIAREPSQWHWNDWVNQLTQIATGITFFALAWFIGRKSEERSKAMANAELITSMGALSTSSARAYAGNDAQALRIAADARAALQHYPRARYQEQHRLTTKVVDSYSDLIFGTFSRADGLPRSIWTGLIGGAVDVIADAQQLADTAGRRRGAQKRQLLDMAEHIRFAINIGEEIRKPDEVPTQTRANTSRDLEEVWRKERAGTSESLSRISQLEVLYRRELTVVHNWNVLKENAEKIKCSAVLHDVAATDEWFSPWFVCRPGNGLLEPVNVVGDSLGNEIARFDKIADVPELPVHPCPLKHSEIPLGMRESTIANHCRILETTATRTICVLTYKVKCWDRTSRRIVLDGNHRLAAARRLDDSSEVQRQPIRVLEFLIEEHERLDSTMQAPEIYKDWEWRGFTPDVHVIRAFGQPFTPQSGPRRTPSDGPI
ncbi:hypothetical protein LDL08_18525 [Nonomuraea glycinis]|uniref:Uncharacterized protein n=1 Tax=Nonomuraea glycinis TaxID=2047744 RepID=A0A918E7H0_9ACTN|nr:hypothetical protein [Nonomuraea glycinis]MCA2178190.1 hypothetical protein [Nonomuraea glycinis]GGP12778.1 hypothetical protein GCM10012278_61940 [Nonomuraea glycinis]